VSNFLFIDWSFKYILLDNWFDRIKIIFVLLDVNSILKQALERTPAYGSIKDVLQSFIADQVINKYR
jgi:hypothetical protein